MTGPVPIDAEPINAVAIVVPVLLVLDHRTDLSARVATQWRDFIRHEIEAEAVGVARREGVRQALDRVQRDQRREDSPATCAITSTPNATKPKWAAHLA